MYHNIGYRVCQHTSAISDITHMVGVVVSLVIHYNDGLPNLGFMASAWPKLLACLITDF